MGGCIPGAIGSQARTLANFALGARFSYSQVLMPVQSYEPGKSPYGLYQMAGNVWEWVQDWYAANYYEVSPERQSARTRTGTVQSATRWILVRPAEISAHLWALQAPPETRNSYTGFRCAKS